MKKQRELGSGKLERTHLLGLKVEKRALPG
jgi:hypothetical protein